MNWFKANKFLSGLLAVVILGGGVLGWFLFSAKGRADDSLEKYNSTSTELKRLKGLPIYPNNENLKKLEAQRSEHQEHVDELLENLAGMTPALETITPEQFQDRLRETVNAFVKDAAAGNMALPKPFYMGFDPYQGTPPRVEAAPFLARSLKAADFLLRQLLTAHVAELRKFDREPIPEEGGKAAAAAAAATGAKPGKAAAGGAPEMVRKRTFSLVFYGDQNSTQLVLNALTAEKKWFMIPRNLVVKNEKQTGPAKDASGAAADPGANPPPPPPPGAPVATGAPGAGAPSAGAKAFEFIVGEEKIETSLLAEVLVFNQAESHAGTSGSGKPKQP